MTAPSPLREELRRMARQSALEWNRDWMAKPLESFAMAFARRVVEEAARGSCVWCMEFPGTLDAAGKRHVTPQGDWTRTCSFDNGWTLLASLSETEEPRS